MPVNLDKIAYLRLFVYLSAVVATICPGILLIFILADNIFYSLPTSKLILFSLSFTIPFLLFNALLITAQDEERTAEDFDERFYMALTISSLMTAFMFYITIILICLAPLKLYTLKTSMTGIEVLYILSSIPKMIKRYKKDKISNK